LKCESENRRKECPLSLALLLFFWYPEINKQPALQKAMKGGQLHSSIPVRLLKEIKGTT